ncbi:MAG: uracil-DNA glycosylase [Bacteroidota bacterium]|jgi:uracil-DNA glycosylase family 4
MTLRSVHRHIEQCRLCPRLVEWREEVAAEKTKRFSDWTYWGKPVPGFGDPDAEVVIVGLAPAAHGANRTGRMFTGDESGKWLYRALHKSGFANRQNSEHVNDGMKLTNCYITAAARCAPPQNKLFPIELQNCRPFLLQEFQLLKKCKVIVGLGKIGFDTAFEVIRSLKKTDLVRKPHFSHVTVVPLSKSLTLIGSYHPSQQNTFTGRLTEPMFDSIFRAVRKELKAL